MLNYIARDYTQEEVEKAEYELDRALIDLPGNSNISEIDRLLYESKKLSFYNTATGGKLLISLEGFDAALKTVISKLLSDDNRINRSTIVSRISLPKPTEQEKRLPINKRYDPYNPGIGKISIFDRWINNLSLCLKPNGYCSKQKYDGFMRNLEGLLEKYANDGITLKNFFLYITKEIQAQRMDERKNDPYTWDRVSESDLKSYEKYDEILEEMLKIMEIYEKAGFPITLVNTNIPELGITNTIKALLDDIDYSKKSKALDLTPNPTIVGKTKNDVMRIITPTNEEVLRVMKNKSKNN